MQNEVILDKTLTDSDGIPAPKVNYSISKNSETMMTHAVARCTDVLEAAGATQVLVNQQMQGAGWHLLGTARMGIDPATSVVNQHGKTHDVDNLYIIDGSVFVTAGAVNPTSTIQAIALYIAEQMKRNARNL